MSPIATTSTFSSRFCLISVSPLDFPFQCRWLVSFCVGEREYRRSCPLLCTTEEKTVVAAVQFVVGKEATDHRTAPATDCSRPERERKGKDRRPVPLALLPQKLESKVTVAAWRRWERTEGRTPPLLARLLLMKSGDEGYCCVHGRMPGRSRCCRLHAVTERAYRQIIRKLHRYRPSAPRSHTRTAERGGPRSCRPDHHRLLPTPRLAMKSSPRAAAAHHRKRREDTRKQRNALLIRPSAATHRREWLLNLLRSLKFCSLLCLFWDVGRASPTRLSGKGSTAALARCFAPPEEKTVVAAVQFVVGKEATDHRNSHRYGLLAPEREAEGEGPSASSACSASAKLESKVTVAAWRRWEEQRGEHRHCCPLLRDEVRREGHCCVHGRMPGRSRCCRLHAVTERGVPSRSSASSTATAHQHHGHTRTAGKGWTEELPPRPPSTTADATTAMKSSPRAAAAHHREKKRTPETEERPVDSLLSVCCFGTLDARPLRVWSLFLCEFDLFSFFVGPFRFRP
nr:hypothetical protein Iba_chr05aCG9960 [Ipomoea batatas]